MRVNLLQDQEHIKYLLWRIEALEKELKDLKNE